MSQEHERGATNTSQAVPTGQEAARDLQLATMLLLDVAGDLPEYIVMNTNPRRDEKYVTVHRPLTAADMRHHLTGKRTYGATLQHGEGTMTRALCFDTDEPSTTAVLENAAKLLAASGYKPLLEPSPAKRGGHLWVIFSERVNAEAARSQVVTIAPELRQVGEYWPGRGNQKVRLPAGKYVTPTVSEWTQLYDAEGERLSRYGREAARILLSHLTPADLIPATAPQAEREPVAAQEQEQQRTRQPRRSAATTPDERHRQQYGDHRMWVAWPDEHYLIDRFNAQYTIADLATYERNGMINASIIGRPERTASVGVTPDGERFTDFGAGARNPDGTQDGGDPFEFYARSRCLEKAEALRELGRDLNRQASRDLLRAARAGEQPPLWVMEIITDKGRAIYNENAARHGHPPLETHSEGLGGFLSPEQEQPPAQAEHKTLELAAQPPALPTCGCVWQAPQQREQPGWEKETVHYQTLEAYKAGTIADLWRVETNKLLASDAKLSPQRAGELAAARLATTAGREYERLETAVRGAITEQEAALYDWLADNFAIKRDLIDLSGTRTLIADMEVEAAYESGQPYEGDYPPPQRPCFHCRVTAWQWTGGRYICGNPGHPPE